MRVGIVELLNNQCGNNPEGTKIVLYASEDVGP